MGTQPVDEYCREIETYLTRKNDGHLIRVVGPSFDLVSRWAAGGVPIKVAFAGIDRYFERYYRKGPRRRPVKIDFCEADVLDVFDEWRRAIGLTAADRVDDSEPIAAVSDPGPSRSLPAHLGRSLLRLTDLRASGRWDDRSAALDSVIDRVARELDGSRGAKGGVRGPARLSVIARLNDLDVELLALARAGVGGEEMAALEREAEREIAAFRDRMRPDAFRAAAQAALDRILRARFGLPTLKY